MQKKAYEMAYALGRISAASVQKNFGDRLVSCGLDILAAVLEDNWAISGRLIHSLEYFILLGIGLNYIDSKAGDILSTEVAAMRFLVTDMQSVAADPSPINIDGVFSKPEAAPVGDSTGDHPTDVGSVVAASEESREIFLSEASGNDSVVTARPMVLEDAIDAMDNEEDAPIDMVGSNLSAGIEIRQSAILDKIRQSGNCRLRDVQELFPNCSERTLRYDLEALIQKDLVERVGAGSATYYKPIE